MTSTKEQKPEVNLIRASNISQCLFDFSNILTRQSVDGVVIINMNDIMAISREVCNQGKFLKEIVSKIPKEYATICYMDARELYDKWRITHVNTENDRKDENILLEFTKQQCVTYGEIYAHAGFEPKQMNTLISFRYDAMHITGFDFKKFIMSCVYTTIKYVTKTFDSQFWLIGDYRPVDYNHIATNTNFLAIVTHDFRFVSLTDIIHKGKFVFSVATGIIPDLTLPYMREYIVTKTVMASNRLECINRMTSQRDKIRAQYESVIETNDPFSHQVICLNLDPEFDSNLLEPIKSLWSSHSYVTIIQNNKKQADSKKKAISGANQLEALINMLNMATTTSTCDDRCDIPVGKVNDTITADLIITTSRVESLHELFGGKQSNNPTKNHIPNTQKNNINYVQLPVLKFGNSLFQPSKLSGLNNLKFPIARYEGSINVIIGQNITWHHFQQITEYIINNPKYPNNIQAKYVDFKINPMIRINLGMMKYATEYFKLNQLGQPMDHSACSRLYTRFKQWLNWVKLSSRLEHPNTTRIIPNDHKQIGIHEECTCCKCISKKGMARYEVGNLPYVDSTVYSIMHETPSFWIPRY